MWTWIEFYEALPDTGLRVVIKVVVIGGQYWDVEGGEGQGLEGLIKPLRPFIKLLRAL